MLQKARADLAASIGGHPTPVQAMLVEQGAQLRLRLVQSDNQVTADKPMTVAESKHYIALANALTRVLLRLGVDEKAKSKPARPSLADHLARHAAAVP